MARAIIDINNHTHNFILNRETLDIIRSFVCVYQNDTDTLFFRPETPKAATSFDWNGEVWFRIDPVTEEFVGIEIENFESVFLKKYPDFAPIWKDFKPIYSKILTRTSHDNSWDSFIRIVIEFLTRLFEDSPQQLAFKETIS